MGVLVGFGVGVRVRVLVGQGVMVGFKVGVFVRVLVGQGVIVGVTGVGVNVGRCVRVRVSVGDKKGVGDFRGVLLGSGVAEGHGVELGMGVEDGLGVLVAVLVNVGDFDAVGVKLGTAVGGSPSTVKLPLRFQVKPAKICTS